MNSSHPSSKSPLPSLESFDSAPEEESILPTRLTVLPLRDAIVFPYTVFPVLIGREPSLKAVAEALNRKKYIFVSAQKDSSIEEPTKDDIYRAGTVARIAQLVKLPNNFVKILVEGFIQARAKRFFDKSPFLEADIQYFTEFDSVKGTTRSARGKVEPTKEFLALTRHADELFNTYVKLNRNIAAEVATAFNNLTDPLHKLYYAAANIQQTVQVRQKILDKFGLREQYFELISILATEIDVLKLEQDLDVKVQESIQRSQKRFLIQEQIRALQQELGDDDEAYPELAKLREQIDSSGMPEEVLKKANEEFDKLKRISAMSPDSGVSRNYLEMLVSLPWKTATPDNLDLDNARRVLDEDHFGLEKIKERILEYITVLNLVGSVKGQVLCFSGPPGVGKTSLARSIARALGRKFVRISLGGVRDEAEIRGHRKTYVGAMPGKIIHSMKRAGTVNPVILLDEVDKMAADFRGDPSSALLEALDPEQNSTFNDHYLEVDYDLSKVLFICTANVKYDIPLPLLDRMEVIELNSYLDFEKAEIARRYLLPKQLERHGIGDVPLRFSDEAIDLLINGYTKEAGVRNLERQIAAVLRKVGRELVEELSAITHSLKDAGEGSSEDALEGSAHKVLSTNATNGAATRSRSQKRSSAQQSLKQSAPMELQNHITEYGSTPETAESDASGASDVPAEALRQQARAMLSKRERIITADDVRKHLKVPPFRRRAHDTSDKVGVVTGLAWTSVGGDILPVEVTIMPGKEKLTLTGKLGDVMKESAMAALSFVRANWQELGVPEYFAADREIHIHVPDGAIPKDGPSAGITIAMALISAASGRAACGVVAMTGEVTLRGNVLPIGGLNEKLLAAKHAGRTIVLIPKDNEPELADIQQQTKEGLTIAPIAHVREALSFVFPAT
jgi:ATP-dependent Lon protease